MEGQNPFQQGNNPTGQGSRAMSKKPRIFIVIIYFFAAVILYLLMTEISLIGPGMKQPVTQNPTANNTTSVHIINTDIAPNTLPPHFPADFPMEKVQTVTHNTTYTSGVGVINSWREFISTNSANQSFNVYKNYFTKNKWTIVTQTMDVKGVFTLKATMNTVFMNIQIVKPDIGGSLVSIIATAPIK